MIDNDQELADFLPSLRAADWVALDTEADSLHAYPEKLCLLQISLPGKDILVDTLAGMDVAPLVETLRDRELIFHGADYDLRLLRRNCGFVPHTVFDTMWAARLLGETEFGLTQLVAKHLGVNLEKGPQKSNWARRPLTERMEAYAQNDTRYLYPLATLLKTALQEKGRLEWLREVCARLIVDCAQERPVDANLVWRVKGSDKLDRRGLAMLRELWRWREQEAIAANKPPYFILSHETLVAVARLAAHEQAFDSHLPKTFSPRRRGNLLAAIDCGLTSSAAQWPEFRQSFGHRLTSAEKHRLDELRNKRDRRATELGLDPTLIASRATLTDLARDWPAHENDLMNWQLVLLRE